MPGSYKGTLTSLEASEIIGAAVGEVLPNVDRHVSVVTDGGEGTIDAFLHNFGGKVRTYEVLGPLGVPVQARTHWSSDQVAVLESAQAVGYSQVPQAKRDPWIMSSFGLGQLIQRVLADGAREIYITMGDSATMDIGIGMLAALGVKFFSNGSAIADPHMKDLTAITRFDHSALTRLINIPITVLCDTKDYLCGADGQAVAYGPQKGISPEDVPLADAALTNFSRLIEQELRTDVTRLQMGSGSGGIAAAISAFFGAPLKHTPEYLANKIDLLSDIRSADLIITGEGRLDDQTRWGKVPHFAASNGKCHCVAIVGSYTATGRRDLEEACEGSLSVITMNPECALSEPRLCLFEAARAVGLLLKTRV